MNLESLDFGKFVDATNLSVNSAALHAEVIACNARSGLTTLQVSREMTSALAANHDPFKVARGHDVTAIIAWAIKTRTKRKRKDGAKITSYLIETQLRLGYTKDHFITTPLRQAIADWEAANTPFKLLSP